MSSTSKIVADGMKRLCGDFTAFVTERGFLRTKDRYWVRLRPHWAETIYFHRRGSSYGGAPADPSIHIRVILGIVVLNDRPPGASIIQYCDSARRNTGYAYHTRFNAITWSTYDRCLEELGLLVDEYAEVWFSEWREPQRLSAHPSIQPSALQTIDEAIAGAAESTQTLKSLGLVGSKLARAKAVMSGS